METTQKLERLSAAAEKATATVNRAANWEANRNNAAARLMAINAAAVILSDNATDERNAESVAAAIEYLHTQFMAQFNAQTKARAAFEASFSAIKKAAAENPNILAMAVNAHGFNFDAAIRGCYQAIKAAEKQERAAAWAERTAAIAERAEWKSRNAAKRAARAAERAEKKSKNVAKRTAATAERAE